MRTHSKRDPAGLDYSASWEPSASHTGGDPQQPRASPVARTLVGIAIILLVALAVVVIALT